MGDSENVLDVAVLRTALEREADPGRAEQMARYMKGHFEFLGLSSPARR